MTDDLRPWGYAPGGYVFTCGDCPENQKIIDRPVGDKRSWRCEAHARAARDAEPTPKPAPDDLIARLRAMYSHRGDGIPTQYVNPDGPEAADEIERLNATLEKVRRSALTLTETQRQIYDHYQKASTINKEAVSTLDSERECNALLTAEIDRLRQTLEWYAEQARLCRLIHSEGDAGRHALSEDGGKRARQALTATRETKP